ncbi:MAG: NAD(P)-dependent oxidoreductase [Acidiferrobacterales bacterium]
MISTPIGFIGLGNMGRPMTENIAKNGYLLVVYDTAGTAERAPAGATVVASSADVAASAETVFLSLPDATASRKVTEEIIASRSATARCVVDTSTIGVQAAHEISGRLKQAGIEYIDAPVSGGVAGARAGTISTMFAGRRETYERLLPVLKCMSKNPFHVGTEPGQGQAMKLANNFLSGVAMAATSEAICFGLSQGLQMKTMLEVLNVSTGQNTATADKFPKRILTESFDAGFDNRLYFKDIRLYLESVHAAKTPHAIGEVCTALWQRFGETRPGVDFTEIYRFIRDRR